MAMKRAAENATDPATGKRLPDAVEYRGVGQYRARKMVDGRRVKKTFETAKHASAWLLKVIVEHREGVHVDRTGLEKITLAELVNNDVAKHMHTEFPSGDFLSRWNRL